MCWVKRGALSEVLKALGSVGPADRPKIGAVANEWKQKIEAALESQKEALSSVELGAQLAKEQIDVTLTGRKLHRGSLHPVTQVTRRIAQIFGRIGFDVTTGPEIETEYLNFEAVNIPKDHPARDMQDSFSWGLECALLRTHTSPVQMRAMCF